MWLDGLLPLPIGSRIELDDGADAVVVGVGLQGMRGEGRRLVLEVERHGAELAEAAVREALAEEDVVEAAEMITEGSTA